MDNRSVFLHSRDFFSADFFGYHRRYYRRIFNARGNKRDKFTPLWSRKAKRSKFFKSSKINGYFAFKIYRYFPYLLGFLLCADFEFICHKCSVFLPFLQIFTHRCGVKLTK